MKGKRNAEEEFIVIVFALFHHSLGVSRNSPASESFGSIVLYTCSSAQ